ncbi:MAG: hypothetical protein EXR62_16555 [Chloroflexi bacterium]|nr:hypothetical protein [Chloroflexota bacterium]
MPATVTYLKLSLIWVEAFPALVDGPLPANAPMDFLWHRAGYEARFNQLSAAPGSLVLPWARSVGSYTHNFWYHYLRNHSPEQISGAESWELLVPFQTGFDLKLKAAWPADPGGADPAKSTWVTVDGYYYPWAVAVVIGINLRADLPLADMVRLACRAAGSGQFEVTQEGQAQRRTLAALAYELLDRMRGQVFGPDAPPGEGKGTPFRVATVIKGSLDDPAALVQAGDAAHHALEALCSGNDEALDGDYELHTLDETRVGLRRGKAASRLYGLARGRAVWIPHKFTSSVLRHSLSCYHDNLTLVSLQTESLCALLELAAAHLQQHPGQGFPLAAMDQLVPAAAGLLGRLYGAAEDTYRSASPPQQMRDNHYDTAIDAVRTSYGWGKLG